MSQGLNPRGSSTSSAAGGVGSLIGSGANSARGDAQNNASIARFMLFPVFINLSSLYYFPPPLLTTLSSSCRSGLILTAHLGSTRSVSGQRRSTDSGLEVGGGFLSALSFQHTECCLVDYYSYQYLTCLSILVLFHIKMISFSYQSSSLS